MVQRHLGRVNRALFKKKAQGVSGCAGRSATEHSVLTSMQLKYAGHSATEHVSLTSQAYASCLHWLLSCFTELSPLEYISCFFLATYDSLRDDFHNLVLAMLVLALAALDLHVPQAIQHGECICRLLAQKNQCFYCVFEALGAGAQENHYFYIHFWLRHTKTITFIP